MNKLHYEYFDEGNQKNTGNHSLEMRYMLTTSDNVTISES